MKFRRRSRGRSEAAGPRPWGGPGEEGNGLFAPVGRVSSDLGKELLIGETNVRGDAYELYEWATWGEKTEHGRIGWRPEKILELLGLEDEGVNLFGIDDDGTVRDSSLWEESETFEAASRIDSRLQKRVHHQPDFDEEFWSFPGS